MPHFCCAGECKNSSDKRPDISFHGLPLDNKALLKTWIAKMRRNPNYFNVNKHVKICSKHFSPEDFINPDAKKRRLKRNAVPSIFAWSKERPQTVARSAVEKLNTSRQEEEEATDTASEGEGDETLNMSGLTLTSRKTQTQEDDFCELTDISHRIPCLHSFSVYHLLSKCTTLSKEEKLFTHYTGFNSYVDFMNTLRFLLPNLDRKNLIYWDSEAGKSSVIDIEKLFEEGETEGENDCVERESTMTRPSAHKLSVEDEFLMLLMKLRMGLSNIDLAERFCVSESTVNNINLTWVNFVYNVLGSLKIWPHRDIIIKHSPEEFIKKYPNTIVIVDATELKIQVPSSLQKHSESYSTYKSNTTFKSLVGVDPNGGIMFVSQLFEGSISDKQIVQRSGFLETVKQKVQCGELKEGDAIMADKGFDIGDDLAKLKLKLNIPPFLKDKVGFEEGDVIKTQTIARHRIHVERAIGFDVAVFYQAKHGTGKSFYYYGTPGLGEEFVRGNSDFTQTVKDMFEAFSIQCGVSYHLKVAQNSFLFFGEFWS
ncbi:THAP domain-containing protein 1 [Stylophora pistillata]|uniref:THAP domain-containing protein 1 n=1 Tax=Stylophora pistillata TaxID=50429 RepID=A0A2B4S9I0_STYPI|nr:THAP domain-containing protein 1 [Stylophora pistillata]